MLQACRHQASELSARTPQFKQGFAHRLAVPQAPCVAFVLACLAPVTELCLLGAILVAVCHKRMHCARPQSVRLLKLRAVRECHLPHLVLAADQCAGVPHRECVQRPRRTHVLLCFERLVAGEQRSRHSQRRARFRRRVGRRPPAVCQRRLARAAVAVAVVRWVLIARNVLSAAVAVKITWVRATPVLLHFANLHTAQTCWRCKLLQWCVGDACRKWNMTSEHGCPGATLRASQMLPKAKVKFSSALSERCRMATCLGALRAAA